jgi:hypothetical protein
MARTFNQRLASHLIKTGNIIVERQGLVAEVYQHAQEHGNYDFASVLLNGLWSKKAYASAKTIKLYLEAHGPFAISFDSESKLFASKQKKNKKGKVGSFSELSVPYNEWEKEKIEKELTAESLIHIIQNAIKKSGDLESEEETGKFQTFIKSLAA